MAKNQVYWLSGNLKSRKKELDKIRLSLSSPDIVRYEKDISFAYLEQQVYSSQCFSDKRIIILDDLPIPAGTKPTMIKHFGKMVENIPEDLTLVFNNIDEPTLLKAIEKNSTVICFADVVDKAKAVAYVQKQIDEADKAISQLDAEFLVENNGYDPNVNGISVDILTLAVKKLISYIGQRKNITKDDVLVNIFPSEEFIIWSIQEALDSKSLERCQNMFAELVSEKDGEANPVSEAVNLLFNMIANRYKMLVFLKEGMAKGLSNSELIAKSSELLKIKSTGNKYGSQLKIDVNEDGQEKRLFSEKAVLYALNSSYGKKPVVEMYTRKELFRIYSTVQDCMVELRYRSGSNELLLLLVDSLFLAICTDIDDAKIEKIRKSHYAF